jgi:hypothetical protein
MSTGIHEPQVSRNGQSDEIRRLEIAFGPDCNLCLTRGPRCPTLTLRVGDQEVHLSTDGQHSSYRRAINQLRLRMPEVRTPPGQT